MISLYPDQCTVLRAFETGLPDDIATYLYDAGHTVSVLNPAVIKAYAQSVLSRTKTDRVDASLIAGFLTNERLAGSASGSSCCYIAPAIVNDSVSPSLPSGV